MTKSDGSQPDKERDQTPRTKTLQEECERNPAGRYRKALGLAGQLERELAESEEHARQADAESDHLRQRLAPMTATEAAQLLDDGFAVKVLNPERGTYWRCPHCGMADYDGHEQSCVIRVLVERLLGRVVPFGTLPVAPSAGVACEDADRLEWLADKIPAYGDYAKEAAIYLVQYAHELRTRSARRLFTDAGVAELDLMEACAGLVNYWTRNLRNFQWEKADEHVKRINAALGANVRASDRGADHG